MSHRHIDAHRKYMQQARELHAVTKDIQEESNSCEVPAYVDHYARLGVSRDATHVAIREAYKQLALAYHPDRGDPESDRKWTGIPEAYKVLSDPNDRLEYDETLTTRDALVAFYAQHNPSKLNNATIETIIDGWYGREVELFEMLKNKYEIVPYTSKSEQSNIGKLSAERVERIRRDSLDSSSLPSPISSAEATAAFAVSPPSVCERVTSLMSCPFSAGRRSAYYDVGLDTPGTTASAAYPRNTPGQCNLPTPLANCPELSTPTPTSHSSDSFATAC